MPTYQVNKVDFPQTWLQYYCAISVTITMLMIGLTMGWPSTAIPELVNGSNRLDVKLTGDEASWLVVAPLLTSIPAALVAGVVIHKIGRKTAILLLDIPHFIAWLLIAFANGRGMLFLARMLYGCCDGIAFTVIPIYLGEIADANIRGLIGSLPCVGMILGIAVINAIGQYQSIFITALISAVFPIIQFTLFLFAPESPYYHIMNDQHEEAKRCMRRLKGVVDVDVEFVRVTEAIQEDQNNKGRFTDLFTIPSNRRTLIIICGLRTVQQFSGIPAITAYTPDILTLKHLVVIYFGVQLFMSCISSFIVDVAGRKPLLLLSCIGTGLASASAAVYFYLLEEVNLDMSSYNAVPVVAMTAYIVLHSVGLTTIPLMMIGEVFQPNIKTFAIAIADIYFCFCYTATVQFFYESEKYIGMYVAFTGFALSSFLGAAFVKTWVPETKGKTLEEIVDYFRGRTSVCCEA